MPCESEIVDLDRGCKAMVPQSVIPSNLRGEEERRVRREVCNEAQDVDGSEVDGCAGGGLATEVEDGLRVEGEGPAEKVDPAEEPRDDAEERSCHRGCYIYFVRRIRDVVRGRVRC